MKELIIGAALVAAPLTAIADVNIRSQSPVYNSETIYETVEVCTQGSEATDKDVLSGAFWGGVIGNNTGDGDAAAGAAIGALLGALSGDEGGCHTERRAVGTRQVLVGYDVTLNVDGKLTTVRVMN